MHLRLNLIALLLVACQGGDDARWVTARNETLVTGVEITGALKATDSESVGPPGISTIWEFKIASLAAEGDEVKPGDDLVSFDTTQLRERKMAKENERDSTRVELAKLRQELALATQDDRLKLAEAEANVRKSSMAANQSMELTGTLAIEQAKLDLKAAEATVEHHRAQIERRERINKGQIELLGARVRAAEKAVALIDKQISDMTVKATRAGTVIVQSKWDDEKFKVGDTVWRAYNVIEVATLDSMRAEGTVDEADFARLEVGQKVRLRLEAHPDHDVTGKLTEIGRSVQRKSRDVPTKVVAVKLSVDPVEGLQLRPGMRFRGEVETQAVADAVTVPLAAVHASASGPIVFRDAAGETEAVAVVLGVRSKDTVQVVKGLEPGDRVALDRGSR
jgi:HlyD family secretion protein